MTWGYTAQVAVYVGFAALAYASWIAWDFDRKWGRSERPKPEI